MSKNALLTMLEKEQLKKEVPSFKVGDTVRVHTRIIEGDKERIQVFMGTVIARKGSGLSETFSVHRVAFGEGMERVFLLNSPRIARIEVLRRGDVRRGKLYYLRGTQGKKAKVKSLLGEKAFRKKTESSSEGEKEQEEVKVSAEEAEVQAAPEVQAEDTPKNEPQSEEKSDA